MTTRFASAGPLGLGLLVGFGVGAGVGLPGGGLANPVGPTETVGALDADAIDGSAEAAADGADAPGEPFWTGTVMTTDAAGAMVVQPTATTATSATTAATARLIESPHLVSVPRRVAREATTAS